MVREGSVIISIPPGPIEALVRHQRGAAATQFQFPPVRLKPRLSSRKRRKPSISIPPGPIEAFRAKASRLVAELFQFPPVRLKRVLRTQPATNLPYFNSPRSD